MLFSHREINSLFLACTASSIALRASRYARCLLRSLTRGMAHSTSQPAKCNSYRVHVAKRLVERAFLMSDLVRAVGQLFVEHHADKR